jgi:phosphoribosylaminoimidazolecarboxamide formyltransferase/IMP cyclohydrolase
MSDKFINSALISVYHKTGLDAIVKRLDDLNIKIYSTGGTQKYIESLGVEVHTVENLTSYPSILGGRVKTLHPKIFGGILAKREQEHLTELAEYDIPEIDLVIVDLYPFQETVAATDDESEIIEKIDIGGISLIRAAAKNYKDLVVIPSKDQYSDLLDILNAKSGLTSINDRKALASKAFAISSGYDTAINQFFSGGKSASAGFDESEAITLRYGENPHQQAKFYGNLDQKFEKISGKELSYNNLVDIDAAVEIIAEFEHNLPTFCILKHTNACGVATRETISEAWDAALAGDPVSAFGGILIANSEIDFETAEKINEIFYEVVIAPSFSNEATDLLTKKKKRVLLRMKDMSVPTERMKTILNGVLWQQCDVIDQTDHQFNTVTKKAPSDRDLQNIIFANKCVKNLKSNTIVLVRDNQLLGMGCGQTSRVDACKQAIDKAIRMGFILDGAAMASDAFFPFPDCVELAHKAGITAVVQPGGSIKDQLSIDYCDANDLAMVFTGIRHFKH